MQETQVQCLDGKDPLEKKMVTHASVLAWRIPWTEEPSGLQSMGLQRVRHDWTFFTEPAERVRLRPYSRRRNIALTSLWFQIRIQFLMRWWKGWSRALCMDPLWQHYSSSSSSSLREYQIKTHERAPPKVCHVYVCKCALQWSTTFVALVVLIYYITACKAFHSLYFLPYDSFSFVLPLDTDSYISHLLFPFSI